MTKHTAGPWISDGETIDLFDFELENRRFWISADGMVIGYVDGFGNKDNEERKANARLIAAAPDLLEALIAISEIDRFDARRITDESPHYVFGRCGEIAIDAIAKATGNNHE